MKVTSAFLLTAMFLGASISHGALTEAQLAPIRKELRSAQLLIASGKLTEGQLKLNAIKPIAEVHLAERWQFVNSLADAVQSEQKGKLADAKASLQALIGSAKAGDQIGALFTAVPRLVRALVKAEKTPQAQALAASMENSFVKDSKELGRHYSMTHMWVGAKDLPKAEVRLTQVAALSKTEAHWNRWRWGADSLLRAHETLDARLAAYGRLIALATDEKAKAAREAIAGGLLVRARILARAGKTTEADKIVQAVKGTVPEGSQADQTTSLVALILSARNASKAGNHAAALTALQQAYDLAKDMKGWECQDVYLAGTALTRACLKAGDSPTAAAFADFLSGPGQKVDPWQLHIDLAGFRRAVGDLTKAEQSLVQAALLAKSSGQKANWAGEAWMLMEKKPSTTQTMGLYDRLAGLAIANGTIEMILKRFLDKVRSKLTHDWRGRSIQEGIDLFNVVKIRAAVAPGLAAEVAQVEKIAAVHALSQAGSYPQMLQKMEEVYELAKDNPDVVESLYRQSTFLWRKLVKLGERTTAEGFVKFLAKENLLKATKLKTAEEQWKSWAGLAWPVINLAPTSEETLVHP